jgi:hypothetical protein
MDYGKPSLNIVSPESISKSSFGHSLYCTFALYVDPTISAGKTIFFSSLFSIVIVAL